METDLQKLLRRLEKAFRNARFPGSHAQRVGYQSEISAFLGKTWEEVTVEDINKTYTLIYFSERGLLYYLPAYLRGIAQNYQKLRYIAFVQIITELGDPKLTQRRPNRQIKDLCTLFSQEQIAVIRDFIRIYEAFLPELTGFASTAEVIQAEKEHLRALIQRADHYWSACLDEP